MFTNPIIDAYNSSDFFGKIIFLSLVFLSITTWSIFVQKFLLQKNVKRLSYTFRTTFQKKRLNPLSLEVNEIHPFATLYRTLKHHTFELLGKNKTALKQQNVTLSASDISLIEAHLMSVTSSLTKKMERNLFVLSTTVSLAPFLGLLGTVWGILLTFNELQSGAFASTNATIMGGLAMALGTTVAGLLVAIPALIAYNYLRSTIAQFSGEMEDFSHFILASVELQYRQVEVRTCLESCDM